MNRFYEILNSISETVSSAAQKTYKGQKRSNLKDSDFLFPETRSFPIVTPNDVPDAISNFGRMKGKMSYDAFLKKLYNKIKNKPDFVAALPEATKQQLGLKKKTGVADATIIPVPVTQVEPKQQEINPRILKKDYVDENNNDNEAQKQKIKISNLVPSNPNTQVSLPNTMRVVSACKIKSGDLVRNINQSCVHYGSEGVVENIEDLPNHMGQVVVYKTTNSGPTWKTGDILKKTESQLTYLPISDTENQMEQPLNDLIAEEDEEESPEMEMMEYKKDFYEMSLGSLRAIATHANEILNSLDKPYVKENLTESWLQGKIAITEDYMRTIHDFIMYVTEAADNVSAADRPGLWENIRRKREKEGKKYRPAKPGDKDRPNKEQWNKLTKDS